MSESNDMLTDSACVDPGPSRRRHTVAVELPDALAAEAITHSDSTLSFMNISAVLGHRPMVDGAIELHLQWTGCVDAAAAAHEEWVPGYLVPSVAVVREYLMTHDASRPAKGTPVSKGHLSSKRAGEKAGGKPYRRVYVSDTPESARVAVASTSSGHASAGAATTTTGASAAAAVAAAAAEAPEARPYPALPLEVCERIESVLGHRLTHEGTHEFRLQWKDGFVPPPELLLSYPHVFVGCSSTSHAGAADAVSGASTFSLVAGAYPAAESHCQWEWWLPGYAVYMGSSVVRDYARGHGVVKSHAIARPGTSGARAALKLAAAKAAVAAAAAAESVAAASVEPVARIAEAGQVLAAAQYESESAGDAAGSRLLSDVCGADTVHKVVDGAVGGACESRCEEAAAGCESVADSVPAAASACAAGAGTDSGGCARDESLVAGAASADASEPADAPGLDAAAIIAAIAAAAAEVCETAASQGAAAAAALPVSTSGDSNTGRAIRVDCGGMEAGSESAAGGAGTGATLSANAATAATPAVHPSVVRVPDRYLQLTQQSARWLEVQAAHCRTVMAPLCRRCWDAVYCDVPRCPLVHAGQLCRHGVDINRGALCAFIQSAHGDSGRPKRAARCAPCPRGLDCHAGLACPRVHPGQRCQHGGDILAGQLQACETAKAAARSAAAAIVAGKGKDDRPILDPKLAAAHKAAMAAAAVQTGATAISARAGSADACRDIAAAAAAAIKQINEAAAAAARTIAEATAAAVAEIRAASAASAQRRLLDHEAALSPPVPLAAASSGDAGGASTTSAATR